MILVAVPADYMKFVKRFDRDLFDLLADNKHRIGWILYSDVEQDQLFGLLEHASQVCAYLLSGRSINR